MSIFHVTIQDAFVIAVEQQARERLERLSALRDTLEIYDKAY